jgi:alpha-tubulin suppressor-like RCC1 family protein
MSLLHGPRVITDALILCLDAADRNSYSGVGTNFYDLTANGNNAFLVNGPTFNNQYFGGIVLDGSKDYISGISSFSLGDTFTISMWLTYNTVPSTTPDTRKKRKKIRLGRGRVYLEDDCEESPRRLKFYLDDSTEQNLWSWGNNSWGQLGDNTNVNKSIPTLVFGNGKEWEVINANVNCNAAIKDNGTLWTWGNNNGGLANNNPSAASRSTPVTTFSGGTNWKLVSCAAATGAGIKNDGTLWVWGRNYYSMLGTNESSPPVNVYYTPITTFAGGTNWDSVSVGYSNMAAIKTNGTLWIWGRNSYGQLGVNDVVTRSTPVTTILGGTNWKSVSISRYDNIGAIKTDGTLWVWGQNTSGNLGINNFTHKSTPVTTILGGTNWKQISIGNQYATAIKTNGTLWVWGTNSYGKLGLNDTVSRYTPVTTILGGTNWKSVAAGALHIAAIKTDGTLWTWGYNLSGQLGVNDTVNRSTPVTTIIGGSTWKSVTSGQYFTMGIKTNGTFTTDFNVDNSTIQTGVVYNIVAVWNGNTMTLYRNNEVVGTYPVTGTLTRTPLDFTISSPIEAFSGNIYNVMIYDSVLSSSDISQNFNALRSRFGI